MRISRIQGTGLGMSVVKIIVSLRMGDIQAASEKEQGTTFAVTFHLLLDKEKDMQAAPFAKLPVRIVDCERAV